MVNISKKYLDKKIQTDAWNTFLSEVKNSDSQEVFISNLKKYFTQSEIIMLEKRLSIKILIKQKLSYKAIGDILDVSPVTISFVKHNFIKAAPVHKQLTPYEREFRKRSPRYKGKHRL